MDLTHYLSGKISPSGSLATYLASSSAGVEATIIAAVDGANPTMLSVGGFGFLYRGGNLWDRARTPTVFTSIAGISVTAGTPVAIWTPASGKRFRLMGYCLATTNASGVVVIFTDGGSEILRCGVPASLVSTVSPSLGNGILSAAANNGLFLDLVSGTGVVLHGYVFGLEE